MTKMSFRNRACRLTNMVGVIILAHRVMLSSRCNLIEDGTPETFSAILAICAGNSSVPGEFPTQRPVTRSFDVLFDLHPNKRLSKQS